MDRLLVWVLEVKVRRDGDEPVTRESLRQVARVTDEAVTLMHHDNGRSLLHVIRHGDEGRHVVAASGRPTANADHCFIASARKLL